MGADLLLKGAGMVHDLSALKLTSFRAISIERPV
jgi:hypothetical protein